MRFCVVSVRAGWARGWQRPAVGPPGHLLVRLSAKYIQRERASSCVLFTWWSDVLRLSLIFTGDSGLRWMIRAAGFHACDNPSRAGNSVDSRFFLQILGILHLLAGCTEKRKGFADLDGWPLTKEVGGLCRVIESNFIRLYSKTRIWKFPC